jgi:hypothetical protein
VVVESLWQNFFLALIGNGNGCGNSPSYTGTVSSPYSTVVVVMVVTVVEGPPTLTPSSQLEALYFIINLNWAHDQNNYMLCVQSRLPLQQHCLIGSSTGTF